ncbi:MAG: LysR family transcriptional regulator [Spirochaetales bacterium]|nr:LysR family transcriptional regulator [Spirochaetales bacterium]
MDLRVVNNIVTIAQESNISAAARKLNITQSALNQQLLKMEDELGTQLFERRSRTLVATYAGTLFLSNAKKMLELEKETYHVIGDIAENTRGEISIAFTPERGGEHFAACYPTFHSMYPGITFKIKEERVKNMAEHLADGTVDLAHIAIRRPNPAFDYDWIDSEKVVLAVPRSNPMLDQISSLKTGRFRLMDPKLLADQPIILSSRETLIRDIVDEIYEKAGLVPRTLFETSSSRTILAMVQSGLAIGFLPQSYAYDSDTVEFLNAGPEYEWMLTVAHRHGYFLSQAERDFIRIYKNVYDEKKRRRSEKRSI